MHGCIAKFFEQLPYEQFVQVYKPSICYASYTSNTVSNKTNQCGINFGNSTYKHNAINQAIT